MLKRPALQPDYGALRAGAGRERGARAAGARNIAPVRIELYWHWRNLESEVLDTLTAALTGAAEAALLKVLAA